MIIPHNHIICITQKDRNTFAMISRFQRPRPTHGETDNRQMAPVNQNHYYLDSLLLTLARFSASWQFQVAERIHITTTKPALDSSQGDKIIILNALSHYIYDKVMRYNNPKQRVVNGILNAISIF